MTTGLRDGTTLHESYKELEKEAKNAYKRVTKANRPKLRVRVRVTKTIKKNGTETVVWKTVTAWAWVAPNGKYFIGYYAGDFNHTLQIFRRKYINQDSGDDTNPTYQVHPSTLDRPSEMVRALRELRSIA